MTHLSRATMNPTEQSKGQSTEIEFICETNSQQDVEALDTAMERASQRMCQRLQLVHHDEIAQARKKVLEAMRAIVNRFD